MWKVWICFPLLLTAQSPDQKGPSLIEAIHSGDIGAVRSALNAGVSPNTSDALGSSALMHACGYGTPAMVKLLLSAGADVNAASQAGFTPLMWAASEPAKLRLLLARGASVSARSKDGNTVLILARQNGFEESIPVLLAAGAADEDGMTPAGKSTLRIPRDLLLQMRSIGIEPMHLNGPGKPDGGELYKAVYLAGGTAESLRGVLEAGIDPNTPVPIITLELPALAFAAHYRNLDQVRLLLERGANPNGRGSRGITPLMAAVAAQSQNPAVIDLLLTHGAKLDMRDDGGRTALDWALLQGDTEVARKLRSAGAPPPAPPTKPPAAVEEPRTPRAAVEKALALLLPAGPTFFRQSGGCISCHNNSLPALAARAALGQGLPVNTQLASHHARAAMATWRPLQENLAVGATSVGGLVANVSYEMAALAEEHFPRNSVTDAAVLALLRLQRSDGSWAIPDGRPPIGGDVLWTALSLRAIQAYAPAALRRRSDLAVHRAAAYLREVHPAGTQDEAFRILGLRWASTPVPALSTYRTHLLARQDRERGGWAQFPSMQPDAYATGMALYALAAAGVSPSDPAYRAGSAYLLKTQLPDGSWFVQTRALAFQPYQETGFPHGPSQFISAAATSWAVIGLAPVIDSGADDRIVSGVRTRP